MLYLKPHGNYINKSNDMQQDYAIVFQYYDIDVSVHKTLNNVDYAFAFE